MTHRHVVLLTVFALLVATPALSQGTLFVEGDKVGIGTPTPTAPLEIDATGTATNNLVRLVRDGVIRYRLFNTALGVKWDFNNDGNGNFSVSKVGTGGAELKLNGAGDMSLMKGNFGIGCDLMDHDLVICPGPDCTATPRSWIDAGSTSFSTSSSRTIKENLDSLAPDDILDKIRTIPVYEYDFVDGPKDRIGIMAEDFHQIFGRGSDKELSGQEVTMALWLAVQELSARVEDLQRARGEGCDPAGGS